MVGEERLQAFERLRFGALFLLSSLDQRQIVLDAHCDSLVKRQGFDSVGRLNGGDTAVIRALRGTLIGRLR